MCFTGAESEAQRDFLITCPEIIQLVTVLDGLSRISLG